MSETNCVTAQKNRLIDTFYRISPDSFHYLKFILEGYDNLAMLSAVSNTTGVVRIRCSRETLPELLELLGSIAPRIARPCL